MKNINLSAFKKIAADANYTTLENKHGHTIRVKHSSLSPEMRQKFEELEQVNAMADGGLVPAYNPNLMPQKPSDTAPLFDLNNLMAGINTQNIPTNPFDLAGNIAVQNGAQPSMPTPMPNNANITTTPPPEVLSAPALPPAAPMPQNPVDVGMELADDGLILQEAGIRNEAKANQNAARQEAQAIASEQAERQNIVKEYTDRADKIANQIDLTSREYAAGKIDPNRFWADKSTLDKGTTILSLFLGGIGAGISGGENIAIKALDKAIETDIDMQRSELNKKENYLGQLQKQYGNIQDAMNIAKAQKADLFALKLQELAAKSKDPQAAARAQILTGQLKEKYGQGIMNTVLAGKKPLSAETVQLKAKVRMARNGLEDMKKAFAGGSNTFSLIGDNDFTEARNRFIEGLGRLQSGGAITDDEVKNFKNLIPHVTDSRAIQLKKLQSMSELLNSLAGEANVEERAYQPAIRQTK